MSPRSSKPAQSATTQTATEQQPGAKATGANSAGTTSSASTTVGNARARSRRPKLPVEVMPAAAADEAAAGAFLRASGLKANAIDALMERASQALVACDYLRAQEMCLRALDKALGASDFERCARAIMPLQEARRQLRQLATDAAQEATQTEHVIRLVQTLPAAGATVAAGFYLLEPPLVGIDAAAFRILAQRSKAPTMVLVKEPTTKAGLWPIVGVGTGDPFPVVVRALVQPPKSLAGAKSLASVRELPLSKALSNELIAWMLAAQEALGDKAIAKVQPEWPADHRVLDLAELLAAVPDHEKLAQAFAAACRQAAVSPRSALPRRRGVAENKYSF